MRLWPHWILPPTQHRRNGSNSLAVEAMIEDLTIAEAAATEGEITSRTVEDIAPVLTIVVTTEETTGESLKPLSRT